jgi:hypothetical protein
MSALNLVAEEGSGEAMMANRLFHLASGPQANSVAGFPVLLTYWRGPI